MHIMTGKKRRVHKEVCACVSSFNIIHTLPHSSSSKLLAYHGLSQLCVLRACDINV